MTAVAIDPATTRTDAGAGVLAIAICSMVPIWITRRTPVSLALTGGQKGATEGPTQRAGARGPDRRGGGGLPDPAGGRRPHHSRARLRMLRVDMGLDVNDVSVGPIHPQPARLSATHPARAGFYERVAARASELPDVEGVAFTNAWPLQQSPVRDVGAGDVAALSTRAGVVGVSPDYFNVLRIPAPRRPRVHRRRIESGPSRWHWSAARCASRLWPSGERGRATATDCPAADNPAVGAPDHREGGRRGRRHPARAHRRRSRRCLPADLPAALQQRVHLPAGLGRSPRPRRGPAAAAGVDRRRGRARRAAPARRDPRPAAGRLRLLGTCSWCSRRSPRVWRWSGSMA